MAGRIKVVINKSDLKTAIFDIETGENPPTNRSELYQRVSERLNKPPGAVLGRIADYGLELRTPVGKKGGGSKGRAKIDIDKDELVAAVELVEGGENPPTNHSELYQRVSEIVGKSVGAVLGRVADYGLELRTPMGRRGAEAGVPRPRRVSSAKEDQTDGETSLDLSEFTGLGLVVEDISDLLTSGKKDRKTNQLIQQAWMSIRRRSGLPACKVTPIGVVSLKDGELLDMAVVHSESAAEEQVALMEEENPGGVFMHRLSPISLATSRSSRMER